MSTTIHQPGHGKTSSSRAIPAREQWLSMLVVLAMVVGLWAQPVRGEDHPDDQYIHVYTMILEADMLAARGQAAAARAKYQQVQRDLRSFQLGHPEWRVNAVAYRIGYVADRLAALAEPAPAPPASSGVTNAPAAPPETNSAPAPSSPQPQAEAN